MRDSDSTVVYSDVVTADGTVRSETLPGGYTVKVTLDIKPVTTTTLLALRTAPAPDPLPPAAARGHSQPLPRPEKKA
ncbi:hypothetical protein [Streptomyces sp. NPDC002990]